LSRGVTLWVLPPLLAALIGGVAGVGFAAVIRMPRVDTLADFRPPLITRLLNAQGEVFSTFARERRVLIEDAEVPELLQQAVLAAEDANFLQHGGVDAQGVLRAILTNALRGRRAQGGSTITMQLARQLFLTPQKRWRRKIEEAFLAVELEKTYS
jgi:penicillin-binding protein 1A